MTQLQKSPPSRPSKPARKQAAGKATASRRTQEQRRNDAETGLLNAAMQVVASKGWVGMTLGEVGTAAGYSRSLATHYFGSKTELLQSLADHIGDNLRKSRGVSERGLGLQGVLDFMRAYLGRSGAQWTYTRALLILMAEAMTDDSDCSSRLAAYNQSTIEFVAQMFQEALERGEISDATNPTNAAVILMGTLRGIMLQALLQGSEIDPRTLEKSVLTLIVRGYAKFPQPWTDRYGL